MEGHGPASAGACSSRNDFGAAAFCGKEFGYKLGYKGHCGGRAPQSRPPQEGDPKRSRPFPVHRRSPTAAKPRLPGGWWTFGQARPGWGSTFRRSFDASSATRRGKHGTVSSGILGGRGRFQGIPTLNPPPEGGIPTATFRSSRMARCSGRKSPRAPATGRQTHGPLRVREGKAAKIRRTERRDGRTPPISPRWPLEGPASATAFNPAWRPQRARAKSDGKTRPAEGVDRRADRPKRAFHYLVP